MTVDLRKHRKDDQLQKRRNVVMEEPTSPLQDTTTKVCFGASVKSILTEFYSILTIFLSKVRHPDFSSHSQQ